MFPLNKNEGFAEGKEERETWCCVSPVTGGILSRNRRWIRHCRALGTAVPFDERTSNEVQNRRGSKWFLPIAGPVNGVEEELSPLVLASSALFQLCSFEPPTSWPWYHQSTPDLEGCSPGPLAACGPRWGLWIRDSSNGTAVVFGSY